MTKQVRLQSNFRQVNTRSSIFFYFMEQFIAWKIAFWEPISITLRGSYKSGHLLVSPDKTPQKP